MERQAPEPKLAPIFIFADTDREASQRIFDRLHNEFCYIPIHNPNLVVRYAQQFATTAVFLAAPIDYPRGGAAALLQRIIDDVGKPVIILLEEWSREEAERWRKMGAADCLPHPTRVARRLESVRAKLQELAVASQDGSAVGKSERT